MERIVIKPFVSFLVNNLCNLTCSHCVSLSGFNFTTGTDLWKDVADDYTKWAEYVELENIVLCGGEPYLHPNLEEWFDNIRALWPNAFIEITTNGTRLLQYLELSRKMINDGNAVIVVSSHDPTTYDKIEQDVLKTLEPYNITVKSNERTNEYEWAVTEYYHNNKMILKYQSVDWMLDPYYTKIENKTLYFEGGGDQEESHKSCPWKEIYTFQHGLLYKCPPVTNYSDAQKQISFEPYAKEVLDRYKACSVNNGYEEIKTFINNLTKSIEVCKLCAYDKKINTFAFHRKVVQDTSLKTKFNKIPVKSI
jgi:MoaA/NifB/PqqE/SkfB family radical SAM enzyme|tara:strand:- start:70 stop:993 length:924 start_codon:yes stop_codon:yes gene_type:complete